MIYIYILKKAPRKRLARETQGTMTNGFLLTYLLSVISPVKAQVAEF